MYSHQVTALDMNRPPVVMIDGISYEMVPLWLWGVLVCVFATGLTALGLVLQKYSHMLNSISTRSVVYYRQPWWLVGISIFAIAQVINLISMSLAPQVMLSCLGATALIFNAVFARIILEEELHAFEVGVMLGMSVAVVMVIATTPVPHTGELTLGEIIEPVMSVQFLAIAACLFISLFLLRLLVLDAKYVTQVPDIEPATWVLCSAAASGYTVNLMKVVSMYVAAWPRTKPHQHWECYVILILACICGIGQVHCLNRGLNTGRAMMVVPTYFALGLLAQLGISELIVLDVPLDPASSIIFATGIVLILVFIVLLVRAKIAYEVDPAAPIDEVAEKVFVSWPSTPVAADSQESEARALLDAVPSSPSTPSLYTHLSKSLPPEDLEKEADLSPFHRLSSKDRSISWSGTWDNDAFKESFEGRQRTYTVSLIGFGVA